MSRRTLRILLLEDNAADAELIIHRLEQSDLEVVAARVESEEEFVRALQEFVPDVVLSDHSLAQFNAISAMQVLRVTRPAVPLIVVSGATDERVTVACLRAGVENFVFKGNLERLGPVIRAALDMRANLAKLSPRQLEVLRLIAEGLSTPEIGRRLDVSAKTVETHRAEVMKRLGIHDLVGLVRYAVRRGLVAPDE